MRDSKIKTYFIKAGFKCALDSFGPR